MVNLGWIGVDLDGTLFEYHQWVGWNVWDIRIVTARVGLPIRKHGADVLHVCDEPTSFCRVTGQKFSDRDMILAISEHCIKHLEFVLPVQCYKDVHMTELWDDRAVQMVPNTGITLADEHEATISAMMGKAQGV